MHMRIQKGMVRAASGIALAALSSMVLSQPLDLDMRCLTPEQQVQLLTRVDELKRKFRVQEGHDRAMKLLDEKAQLGPIAIDCKRRLDTLTQALGANLSGCPQKIDQYNSIVTALDDQMNQIALVQTIIKNQLLLERSKWPSCR